MRLISRRTFLQRVLITMGGLAGVGVASGTYAAAIEPGWIDLVRLRLPLPRLLPQFHGYRVAHISDIHMDKWMTYGRLRTVVDLINNEQPDLVALTGDFVTYHPRRYVGDLIAALSTLAPRDAVVAVLGNHDHWTNAGVVREALRAAGVRELNNAVYSMMRGDAVLHVAGVDCVTVGASRLDDVLEQIPSKGAALLLAHEPDFADRSAATGRFDLQLSGHSHGGQVRVPFVGAPRLPWLARKYPLGLYHVGSMLQYTTRGVGMVPPHVRFGCRPEITMLTLTTGTNDAG